MAVFERVKAGDVLYDVHREKMGNTTMSRLGCWVVRVLSVDYEKKTARISWNDNPVREVTWRYFKTLRRSKPGQKKAGTR